VDARIHRHFRGQGKTCGSMGSHFTARILSVTADHLTPDDAVRKKIIGWKNGKMLDDAVALRFAGAMHALVLSGRDPALASVYPPNDAPADDDALWQLLETAIAQNEQFVVDFLDYPPQTNETGRAAVLMLGFQEAARETGLPMFMLELGASAGLNQHWDSFHYDLGGSTWGPEDSPVRLAPEWRGRAPDLDALERSATYACDLNPLDITDADQALRLRSYCWPDQPVRLERLDGALSIAQEQGVRLARADAADWIAASLALRPGGRTTVVYHSIFWQYMPVETQRAVRSAIEVAGDLADERAPLCWVRMEPYEEDRHKAALYYTKWPDPERRILAFADYHGWWVEPT
jgi:hypothetical protein